MIEEPISNVSPREASELCEHEAIILDLREEYVNQYKQFDVPVVIQIPLGRISNDFCQLPKDRLIIVADSSGVRSKDAIGLLRENGFTQLANLSGGMVEWEKDGMPLVIDNREKLTGSCACQLRARDKTGEEKTKE